MTTDILHIDNDVLATNSLATRKFLTSSSTVEFPALAESVKYVYRLSSESNRRVQMLEHIKEITEELQTQGINPAYFESEDAVMLSWYDTSDALNSIAVRLDKCKGVWSSVKEGNVQGRTDFDTLDKFLSFNLA